MLTYLAFFFNRVAGLTLSILTVNWSVELATHRAVLAKAELLRHFTSQAYQLTACIFQGRRLREQQSKSEVGTKVLK